MTTSSVAWVRFLLQIQHLLFVSLYVMVILNRIGTILMILDKYRLLNAGIKLRILLGFPANTYAIHLIPELRIISIILTRLLPGFVLPWMFLLILKVRNRLIFQVMVMVVFISI